VPRKKLNGKIGDLCQVIHQNGTRVTFLLVSHDKKYCHVMKKEIPNWNVAVITSTNPSIFGFSEVFDRLLGSTENSHTWTLLAR